MPAPIPPLTPQIQTLVALANEEAASAGLSFIWPQHVLLAVLREPTLRAAQTMSRLGLRVKETRESAREMVRPDADVVVSGRLPLHPFTRRALRRTSQIAAGCGSESTDDTHLLLALIENPRRPASRLLRRLGVDPKHVRLLLTGNEPPGDTEDTPQPVALDYRPPDHRPWWKALFGR
jgi:ATP-dependent Clp protease ATP-binding subunit ClpC